MTETRGRRLELRAVLLSARRPSAVSTSQVGRRDTRRSVRHPPVPVRHYSLSLLIQTTLSAVLSLLRSSTRTKVRLPEGAPLCRYSSVFVSGSDESWGVRQSFTPSLTSRTLSSDRSSSLPFFRESVLVRVLFLGPRGLLL